MNFEEAMQSITKVYTSGDESLCLIKDMTLKIEFIDNETMRVSCENWYNKSSARQIEGEHKIKDVSKLELTFPQFMTVT